MVVVSLEVEDVSVQLELSVLLLFVGLALLSLLFVKLVAFVVSTSSRVVLTPLA